ncbi:HAD family phosphatase [Candidatus Pacearchaeota archaeon]|nr:HAD family phosphatase [Candidatus Pacearchaeota archaeon]
MTIEAILFDKDGTLVDTETKKAESHRLALEEFGVPNGDLWYLNHLGILGPLLSQLQVDEFDLSVSSDEIRKIRKNHYKNITKKGPIPIKQTIDFLKSIPEETYFIGLVTQDFRDSTYNELQVLGLNTFFHTYVTNEDVLPEQSKPHPAPYRLAAKRLYLPPEKCLAIEDNNKGVESAKSAGMYCIAIRMPHNKHMDLTNADLIVDDLSKYSPDTLISLLT